MKKNRYFNLFLVIGLIFLSINVINLLSVIGLSKSFFFNLNQFLSQYSSLILIFTPIFGLFSMTVILFLLIERIAKSIKKRFPKRYPSMAFEDIARNIGDIFQIFLVLSIVFAVALGPILGYAVIDNYDQQQLSLYYGSHYSTNYYSSNYNYTSLSESLNKISDLQWSIILKIQGEVSYFKNQQYQYSFSDTQDLYFIAGNYSSVVDKNLLPENFNSQDFVNQTIDSGYYSFIKNDDLKQSGFELPQFIKFEYIYNRTQKNISTLLPETNAIDYLPGVYMGVNGYKKPFQPNTYIGSYYLSKLILFLQLPSELTMLTTDFQINFLFSFTGPNVEKNIASVESIIHHNINSNYDDSINKFKPNDNANWITYQVNDVFVQSMNYSLIGSIFLIFLM